jgi:hypothetical protein
LLPARRQAGTITSRERISAASTIVYCRIGSVVHTRLPDHLLGFGQVRNHDGS